MPDAAQQLCLECGLCCNGVIFADGQLQPEDDVARLKELGLKLKCGEKFHQPCAAHTKGCCAIYSERPVYCRQFDCALLKSVSSGEISNDQAVTIIDNARTRAAKVDRLLQKLGDSDEHSALVLRFRRTSKALLNAPTVRETAALFSELTLAMHRLNLLLNQKFYPPET